MYAVHVELLGRHLLRQIKAALLFLLCRELGQQFLNLLLHPSDLLRLALDDFLLLRHTFLETHGRLLLVLKILCEHFLGVLQRLPLLLTLHQLHLESYVVSLHVHSRNLLLRRLHRFQRALRG